MYMCMHVCVRMACGGINLVCIYIITTIISHYIKIFHNV